MIDARTAICAVSVSLISPIIITFGSCLKILLNTVAKFKPMSLFTCTWLIPSISISTGSSTVIRLVPLTFNFCSNIFKNGILENFIIVDTPGLNQNLKSNTKERMINYYNRADGVIWLLDAQNIVAKSSEELIEVLRKEYIIDDKFDNIICVVNKIDVINKNSRENEFQKTLTKKVF